MDAISPDMQELYTLAEQAAKNAYVPYSKFSVGAALRCRDGAVFTGCNVENASFGLTICAERVACSSAIAAGQKDFDIIAIFVNTDSGSPCGACRQFLYEFAPNLRVLYMSNGRLVSRSLADLLVDGFEPSALA